jgi:antitoxin HicB
MEAEFELTIKKLPEGVYLAISPDVPGLVAQGRTVEETIEIAKDVARKLYESYTDRGEKPPFKLIWRKTNRINVVIPVGA